jgi:nucleoside 2-deoxyribosyltransferase
VTKAKPQAGQGEAVYLAGPMFSAPETKAQLQIANKLQAEGFDPYLPQRDGIEVAAVMEKIRFPLFASPQDVLEVTQFARKLVFALDVFQCLDRCAAVVFNLDGRVPDEGSIMEASLAWTANKPVVLYKTTFVTMLGGFDNPMLAGLGMSWACVDKLTQLPGEVARAIAGTGSSNARPFTPGPHVAAVIALGREVSRRMADVRTITGLKSEQIPDAVRAFREQLKPLLLAADLWESHVPHLMQPVS